MNFKNELDILLLADTLHSKQCDKKHVDKISINDSTVCDHLYHNRMYQLSKKVSEAQKKSSYYTKAKQIYELCEGMNTNNIIKLIKTIIN